MALWSLFVQLDIGGAAPAVTSLRGRRSVRGGKGENERAKRFLSKTAIIALSFRQFVG